MNIGQAAAASGISAKMIRYYERIELIAPGPRTAAGYRIYQPRDIHGLKFVRQCRRLGFTVEEIRRLLALWYDHDRASSEVKSIALAHVVELERRIAELAAMRTTLLDLARECHGNERPECPILDGLAAAEESTTTDGGTRGWL